MAETNRPNGSKFDDIDPMETREWLESIDSVLKSSGPERAHFLLEQLIDHTRRSGTYLPFKPNTAYINTIAAAHEKEYPGDRTIERRIEAYLRWNALAMVVLANRQNSSHRSSHTPPRHVESSACPQCPTTSSPAIGSMQIALE
jgi:pyruvate dehydrogenase complex dehydrogenase (E1) component